MRCLLACALVAGRAAARRQRPELDRYKSFINEHAIGARAPSSRRSSTATASWCRNRAATSPSSGPARFRWVYDKPADQVIVGDGKRVWIYDRHLNQVTVRKLDQALGSTPAALLAGSDATREAFALSDAGREGRARVAGGQAAGARGGFRARTHGLQAKRARGDGAHRQLRPDHRAALLQARAQSQGRPGASSASTPPKGADVLGEKRSGDVGPFRQARSRSRRSPKRCDPNRSTRSSARSTCSARASRCASPSSPASRTR